MAHQDGQVARARGFAAGEDELVSGRFMYSTAAFYLSTDLILTSRRFIATRPNTLLGLIPVGTRRSNFPIENIAGVSAGTRFAVGGLLIGILALLIGLPALAISGAQVLGVLLIILGLNAIISAPRQAIEVMNSGGGTIVFPVSFFERHRTLEFAANVAEAIARQGHSAQLVSPPSMSASSSTDARSALRHLEDLRAEGLISPEEYAAKRAEVIGRL